MEERRIDENERNFETEGKKEKSGLSKAKIAGFLVGGALAAYGGIKLAKNKLGGKIADMAEKKAEEKESKELDKLDKDLDKISDKIKKIKDSRAKRHPEVPEEEPKEDQAQDEKKSKKK